MKTRKSLVTILAMAITLIASAVEKPKMNVQSLNSDQVLVTFLSEKATELEVSIYDNDGSIVYYKMSKKPIQSFNKIFDVKNLENGNYAMQVEINGLILKRVLEITTDKIYIGDPEKHSAPLFVQRDERLVISHLNFENKNYQLNIYDESGLVYKKKLANESPLHSGFDLSNLESGNYQVVLTSGTNTFNYSFKR